MPLQQISVSPLDWGKENINNGSQDQEWRMQEPVFAPSSQQPQQIGPERCASQASTLSTNHDICRICHCEGDSDAPLIAPCYCSGSLRHVHEACLQQWIKSSDIRSCELCKFQFVMQSKIKPFAEWEKLDMSPVERRKLACSVTFYGVALACVGWSLYVLIDRIAEEVMSSMVSSETAQRDFLKWPFWTKLVVVAVGFTGGLFFMHVQCKAYLGLLRRWRAFNRIICVQNAPDRPSLSRSTSTRPLSKTETLPEVHHSRSPLSEEGGSTAVQLGGLGSSDKTAVEEEGLKNSSLDAVVVLGGSGDRGWKGEAVGVGSEGEGTEVDELSGLLTTAQSDRAGPLGDICSSAHGSASYVQSPQVLIVSGSGGGGGQVGGDRSSVSLGSRSPLLPWDRGGSPI